MIMFIVSMNDDVLHGHNSGFATGADTSGAAPVDVLAGVGGSMQAVCVSIKQQYHSPFRSPLECCH